METFKFPSDNKNVILALGAESAGNFSVFYNGKIYFSENFGDLLQDANFEKFKKELNAFLKKEGIKPDIILTDLHPLYKTTILGKKLAKKYKAKNIQIQHHIAHIFSAIGDYVIEHRTWNMEYNFTGIALDGTGYGLDGKIWGGEIFQFSPFVKGGLKGDFYNIRRLGHLENQTMIGGDLAVKEPARMLISILSKFKDSASIYPYMERFYTKNEFEVLYNQLQKNFNCIETSSASRVLDAVSILLGFCGNKRNYKHEPIFLLERNSTIPYNDLRPKIIKARNEESRSMNYELSTTHLFEYLIKNIKKDKQRLAATAQLYIAQGLYEIIKCSGETATSKNIFMAGGIADNKIISSYLKPKGAYKNKSAPRGDAGLSFGQIIHYLLADSWN